MTRRQVLKALGISAAALSLPHAAHADLLSWFKAVSYTHLTLPTTPYV